MLRRAFFIPLLLVLTCTSSAQEKLKELTLKDAITKAGTDFAPDHLKGLQWIEGSIDFSLREG